MREGIGGRRRGGQGAAHAFAEQGLHGSDAPTALSAGPACRGDIEFVTCTGLDGGADVVVRDDLAVADEHAVPQGERRMAILGLPYRHRSRATPAGQNEIPIRAHK